jgi:hypothetical protein
MRLQRRLEMNGIIFGTDIIKKLLKLTNHNHYMAISEEPTSTHQSIRELQSMKVE